MCLYSNNRKIYTAKKDRTVYKTMTEGADGLRTPYQGVKLPFDKLLPLVRIRTEFNWYTTKYIVQEGYHAFVSKESAKLLTDNSLFNLTVLTCTIPAGTRYKTGNVGDIVAETMIIHSK